MMFLTTLASVPLIYGAIKLEEEKDLIYEEEKFLIKEHGKALSFFMFLFFGFILFIMVYILANRIGKCIVSNTIKGY